MKNLTIKTIFLLNRKLYLTCLLLLIPLITINAILVKPKKNISNSETIENYNKDLNINSELDENTLENLLLPDLVDMNVIKNKAHPRLFMFANEEKYVNTTGTQFKKIHDFVINKANLFITTDEHNSQINDLNLSGSGRAINESRLAVKSIFYLCYAYRKTKNTKYSNIAKKLLNKITSYDKWRPNGGAQDLEISEFGFALGIGYDWLYSELSDQEKVNIRNSINNNVFSKLNNTSQEKNFWTANTNWNQVCISGGSLAAIAIYGDASNTINIAAKDYLLKGIEKNKEPMKKLYKNISYEEGPMYYGYGTTYEVMFLSALKRLYPSNPSVNDLINTENFLKSSSYMKNVTGPTFKYFNYSDCTASKAPLPGAIWMAKRSNDRNQLYEEVRALDNNKYLKDNNLETGGLLPLALIFSRDISLSGIPVPSEKLWVNKDNSLATVHTNWKNDGLFLGVKAGKIGPSHSHMDAGSFVYESQGIRWSNDLGKYDYSQATGSDYTKDITQNSKRWSIFRVNNLNHSTVSIKKNGSWLWQRHNVGGAANITTKYDNNTSRGVKVNLLPVLNLNNDLKEAFRRIYIVDNDHLKIVDKIQTGGQATDFYWNMVAGVNATIQKTNSNQNELQITDRTEGGDSRSVYLNVSTNNNSVGIIMVTSRPNTGFPTNEVANGKNIGYTTTIPANTTVEITVTIKKNSNYAKSLINEKIAYNPDSGELDTEDISVYPNPVKDYLFLKGLTNTSSEKVNFKIFDVKGSCVIDKTFNKEALVSEASIDLSFLNKGMYLLQVISDEKTTIKKIIKE